MRWPSLCRLFHTIWPINVYEARDQTIHPHHHQLMGYLQLVLDAPTTLSPRLHVHTPLAWGSTPPTQPLDKIATNLLAWVDTACVMAASSLTQAKLIQQLQRTPTSVLEPLFLLLGTAQQDSMLSASRARDMCVFTQPCACSVAASATAVATRFRESTRATTATTEDATLPTLPIPLAAVVDRVCMRTLTSRVYPVVLHWMSTGDGVSYEEVRLIRYTQGAVDARGRSIECRIRRLDKTGSSAYKSVNIATLVFPAGVAPPAATSTDGVTTTGQTHKATRTVPVVPPPREDLAHSPTLCGLAGLSMRTDAPLQTPHHVGRLYVQMGISGVTPVGVYTESHLDDGTTLRRYTFEADPKRVYTHRSRRRTDGVRV